MGLPQLCRHRQTTAAVLLRKLNIVEEEEEANLHNSQPRKEDLKLF